MRYLSISVLLLLVSVSAVAQQRTVKVRLFWQHPPERIRVEPNGATLKRCGTCPEKQLTAPIDIGASSSTMQVISGRARLSGEGFRSFPIDGLLTIQPHAGFLLLTLTMPLEDYVAAVLAGESSSFKSDEALKAMAVAALTYAVHFGSRHKLEGFDFCDTTHCQDARLGNESPRVREAVTATQGELLWYQGRPAATYYHRSCGGELENAFSLDRNLHAPYLRLRQDQYCSRSDEWRVDIAKSDLSRAITRPVKTITVAARSESGRVQTVFVNQQPMNAVDFRLAIGRVLGWDKVKSDLYQAEDRGDHISIRGRGQGHGVGLCQYGADRMGQQGRNYREILAYYYPGTTLGINAQGLAWLTLPGESLDIVSTNRNDAAVLLPAAERALRFAIDRVGSPIMARPQVKVFPTIAIYRNGTGEPGWVAASTRGNVVRLQPLATLRRTNALESTLRHEFLHMVIESQTKAPSPLWFREGLVIYLENPAATKPAHMEGFRLEHLLRSAKTEREMRSAYRASASAVAELVLRHGLPTVLQWARNGLPQNP